MLRIARVIALLLLSLGGPGLACSSAQSADWCSSCPWLRCGCTQPPQPGELPPPHRNHTVRLAALAGRLTVTGPGCGFYVNSNSELHTELSRAVRNGATNLTLTSLGQAECQLTLATAEGINFAAVNF